MIFRWIKTKFPESSDKENLLAEFTKFLFLQKLHNNDLQGGLALIRDHIKYFKSPENQKSEEKMKTEYLFFSGKQAFD